MATGAISDPMSDFNVQELSEEQMRRAVDVAHGAHKLVMAHAEGQDGIKSALRAGVDSIQHGTLLDVEGAALMEKKGTWLVPTLQRAAPKSHKIFELDRALVMHRNWTCSAKRIQGLSGLKGR